MYMGLDISLHISASAVTFLDFIVNSGGGEPAKNIRQT